MHYYTGIGSRQTPENVLKRMSKYARQLSERGYTLRSGGAEGADQAFANGAGSNSEIFLPKHVMPWAREEVKVHMPNDRGELSSFKPFVQGLLARNMMQVLGEDKADLQYSQFIVCWAPSLEYQDSSAGGTGYAIRCANYYSIPVYNLFDAQQLIVFEEKHELGG